MGATVFWQHSISHDAVTVRANKRRLPVKSPANGAAAAFSEITYKPTQKLIAAFDAVQSSGQLSNVEIPKIP